jgi:uncharacterized circularly permuted ATP-grasp superfamily protein
LQKTVGKLGSSVENPNGFFIASRNETYFEHVYLSSLGFKLVEGSDLLVRICLKTIDQLERVDVIIKRIDDQWCDPLELNKSSLLNSRTITSNAFRKCVCY